MLSGAEGLKIIRYAAFATDGPVTAARPFHRLGGGLLGWAAAALVVIAGSSYWLGTRTVSVDRTADHPVGSEVSPQAPQAEPTPSRRAAEATASSTFVPPAPAIMPVPDAEQTRTTEPDVRTESAHGTRSRLAATESSQKSAGATDSDFAHSEPATALSRRLVRIGRFATATDAQQGWARIVHQWPGMQGLSTAAVAIQSLRDGRTYYRVQVSTTSPAHSEVVCQRARDLDQSCTIIGSDEGSTESAI